MLSLESSAILQYSQNVKDVITMYYAASDYKTHFTKWPMSFVVLLTFSFVRSEIYSQTENT